MSHLQTLFDRLSSQAILADIEGELERKFKILGSEYGTDLDVSWLPLEIRLRDILASASKVKHDMTKTTKSSANRIAEVDLSMASSRNSAKCCDCSMVVFDAHSFYCYCCSNRSSLKNI